MGGAFILVALSLLVGYWFVSQSNEEAEISKVLEQLGSEAQRQTLEDFADYVEKRKDAYPDIYVLLAQRNKVRTLSGSEQFQTRWRAGTLRQSIEWPVIAPPSARNARSVPSWLSAEAKESKAYVSDWVSMTAYRGTQDTSSPVRIRARYFYVPEREASGQPGLLLVAGRNEGAAKALMWPVLMSAFGLIVFIPIFVAVSSYYTASFVAQRIDGIAETSTNIIHGDLTRRVPMGKGDDEFDGLSKTLNTMLDQIERLLNGMKEVSDNIAHDLKTPLFRLRSRIEVALLDVDKREQSSSAREALEVALKEAERLLATFNALLSIARLEAGVPRENKREDVGGIMRDVAELYGPAAEERGLTLTTTSPQGLFIECNRELIVQALSNLVDNALKYSPEMTRVTLDAQSVRSQRGDRRLIEISVTDEGPGIPADDRDHVIKRFVRLDRGRGAPGSGLGLSLVSAIAQLHEAQLVLGDGTHGRGLAVKLMFPAA